MKNIMVIRSCAPLSRSLVPILAIEVWCVRLRLDDPGKSRIVCLGFECRYLLRKMGLSRS